ncbi:hypothetical protein HUJ05_000103 [Dendroctonus ponderosae]|nr:hypothetical protein HUJ05_000103 [Dendroctonus ponderosae]
MDSVSKPLEVPEEFPFPFAPYDIQLEFMQKLYKVLDQGQLGIFESPTGTGKSLSIICGAIKWLKDFNNNSKQTLSAHIEALEQEKQNYASEEKDWFNAQSKGIEITRILNGLKIEQKQQIDYEQKIEKIRNENSKKKTKFFKKSNKETPAIPEEANQDNAEIEDEDILLNEDTPVENDEDDEDSDVNATFQPTQIIIASRTHSQLSQFIGEIKKSTFQDDIRVVSLASRQNYCINPTVKKLNSMPLINEKCLDMQKKGQTKSKDCDGKVLKRQKNSNCQCPYYKQSNIEDLRDFALNQVHDIEDLVQVGKEINACPYYASRKAAEDAEVIFVPYNTLLHKSTREANGVKLKNNIVIIDEAHNLLEALAQMHGSELTYPQLYYSYHSLRCYKERYNMMFSTVTLRSLNQLIFVTLISKLFPETDFKDESTNISTLQSFVLAAGIDQYNFFNLIKFCKASRLPQKVGRLFILLVRSYSLKYPTSEEQIKKEPPKKGVRDFLASIGNKKPVEQKPVEAPKFTVPINPLLAVISFLESLMYSYDDGRILITNSPDKQNCKLQFLLLNPAGSFSDIVKDARSVVVAGGTMKPNAEFRDRLFIGAGASAARIVEFSCDHIIPPENILPIAVTKGLNNEKLLFNFTNRMSMGNCLKDILKRACETVKGGIVVFFPSYNYENWFFEHVKALDFGRTLFREPQKAASVDEVLEKYGATIRKSKIGAILFSVVGGKLSEGLNFSDDLGRCVIVVGLPYANITSPDLKEKMAFLDKKEGHGMGQQFYENLCMKAVNQCIGRAVRHRNDYATVLLLDERYGRPNTHRALPDWIKRSLQVRGGSEAFDLIIQFFKGKENIQV